MPISPAQQQNPDLPRYSLPLDSCVGDAGPTPEQAAQISKPGAKTTAAPNLRPSGGSTTAGGGIGKVPSQTGGQVPTGYDGP